MRAIATILWISVSTASLASERVITYDSRRDTLPARLDDRAVDVGVRDRVINPDYQAWMLNHQTPAMIDVDTQISVPITGTLAQARADLRAAVLAAYPALLRERGISRREAAREASAGAASANTVPQLRARVARLAELVEELQDRIELLEMRNFNDR